MSIKGALFAKGEETKRRRSNAFAQPRSWCCRQAEKLAVSEEEVAPYLAQIAVSNNIPPERYEEWLKTSS